MRLVKITDLPPWYEVNPYIQTGYRPVMGFWRTLGTMFQWHNETLNIYSHLLPGLYYLLQWFLQKPDCSIDCSLSISYGYFSAALMGLCSGIGHTLYSVSPRINQIVWKLDFTGIVALNGSHLLLDSYVLCVVLLNNIVLFRTGVVIQSLCIAAVFYQIWSKPLAVGQTWGMLYPAITCVPATLSLYTWIQLYVTDPLILNMSQASLNCSICIWIAGLLFFKGRFPERCFPLIFDYIPSHVWHHLFCVLAVVTAFQCFPALQQFEYYQRIH
jgi:adiponectin receptor